MALVAQMTFPSSREMIVEQIKGLLRETWWLWLLFALMVAFMSFFISAMFLFMYPILAVVCTYFAFVRYDEHGNPKEEL